jgi:hypothetical protein
MSFSLKIKPPILTPKSSFLPAPSSLTYPDSPGIFPLGLCPPHFWSGNRPLTCGILSIACSNLSRSFTPRATRKNHLVTSQSINLKYLLSPLLRIISFPGLHVINIVIESLFAFTNTLERLDPGIVLNDSIGVLPLPRGGHSHILEQLFESEQWLFLREVVVVAEFADLT